MKLFCKFFLIISTLALFFSCKEENKDAEAIRSVEVNFDMVRFDRLFANATQNDIAELKTNYPYLLSLIHI